MIEPVDDFFVDNLFKPGDIDDRTGLGIGLAADSDFQQIVVTVAVGVGALAEGPLVVGSAELGAVQAVGGGTGLRGLRHEGLGSSPQRKGRLTDALDHRNDLWVSVAA